MAKGVLGNDPFLRGAPAREETAIKSPQKAAPPTPEPKPVIPSKPNRAPRPAAASQAAPVPGKRSWPKAADKNKPARDSVRELMSKAEAPPASANKSKLVSKEELSPTANKNKSASKEEPVVAASKDERSASANKTKSVSKDEPAAAASASKSKEELSASAKKTPISNEEPAAAANKNKANPAENKTTSAPAPSAPVLQTPPARLSNWEPTSHPGSPQMVVLVDGIATPHSGSPHLIARLGELDAPPGRIKEFVPHANTPELKAVLGKEVVPHQDSPEVAAVLSGPAMAHRGSPEVVADLGGRQAVQHSLSPELVEVLPPRRAAETEPARRRPLVVEIVEKTAHMGGREISAVPRSSRPVLALDAARDLFNGSMRPIAGAARGIFSAARIALGLGSPGDLDVWGKDLTLTRSLEPLSDFLYEKYFRVTVDGADHVPSGAVILVANHSGALPLDGPMLHLALRRERADLPDARWLMEDQVFHAPFVGVLANRLGAVRANPENATRLLDEKRPVAVFPEGIQGISKRFGQRYQLKRFGRGGYVKLAVRLKVPIVPVAIVGAEESMPLLARLPASLFGLPYLPITVPPLPARWHIRFGAPMDLSQAPENAESDLAWVAQTNDRTRETIEGMLTAMLRSRTSVF